jgi:hypothetical protein
VPLGHRGRSRGACRSPRTRPLRNEAVPVPPTDRRRAPDSRRRRGARDSRTRGRR